MGKSDIAGEDWLIDDTGAEDKTSTDENHRPWKILIVDDEEDIHSTTRLTLRGMHYRNRPLQLLSAYSGAEGFALLEQHPDTAIVLLDVVMETDDAGLLLAERIRGELDNSLTRIILRTGQPGQAPEEKVIVQYDINDYKAKTELTSRKLFVTVVASLRTYESLLAIDLSRHGLRRILKGTENLYQYSSLQEFSSGVLSQISAILDVGADGVLCAKRTDARSAVQGEEDTPEFEIIAGTGPYAVFPQQGRLPDAHVFADLVAKAFERGESFFEHPYDVLHFSTKHGYRFAIVLTPPWPLEDYQKELLNVFCDRMGSAFDNLYLYQQLRASNEATVMTLADLAEFRDISTGQHIVRVGRLTRAVVAQLLKEGKFTEQISDTFSAMIGTAAILHDVGKVVTPDHILFKDGKYSEEESLLMQEHARKGEAILGRAADLISGDSYLAYAAQIAGGHHERYDGSGYPRGLKGDEIPLASRIVAVVDVFDALVHRRSDREPMTVEEAIDYVRASAGTLFDPAVVDSFLKVVEKDPGCWATDQNGPVAGL